MQLMWDDGATMSEISDAVGHPYGSVGAYMTTHRDLFPRRRIRIYRWMLEDVGIMYDFGIPIDKIAKAMGVTNNTAHNLVYKSMKLGFCRPRRPRDGQRGAGGGRYQNEVRDELQQ